MKLKPKTNNQELLRSVKKASTTVEKLLRAELAQERGAHKKTLSELHASQEANESLTRENAMLRQKLTESGYEAQGAYEDDEHLRTVIGTLRARIHELLRSTDVDAAIYDLPKLTISSETFETAAVCDHKKELPDCKYLHPAGYCLYRLLEDPTAAEFCVAGPCPHYLKRDASTAGALTSQSAAATDCYYFKNNECWCIGHSSMCEGPCNDYISKDEIEARRL